MDRNQLVYGTAIGLILGAAIGFFTASAIVGVSVGVAMALGFSGILANLWHHRSRVTNSDHTRGERP